MRTKEDRKTAERAAASEILDLERRHECRIIARVGWDPLKGMSADVKPYRIVNGNADTSPDGQATADRFMQSVMDVVERHQVVIMPKMDVVQNAATATWVVIGHELIPSANSSEARPSQPVPQQSNDTAVVDQPDVDASPEVP